MAENKSVSDLLDQLLFPHIFKVFRIAVQPSKLLTAFLAVAILSVLGWIMDVSGTVATSELFSPTDHATELHCFVHDREKTDEFIEDYRNSGNGAGVCSVVWGFCSEQFNEAVINILHFDLVNVFDNISACISAAVWAFSYHTVYSILFSLASLVVISIAAGAICRSAALQFARDERPGFVESLRFSTENFKSFFMALLAPGCVLFFFGICIFLFGVLLNIPFIGELIIGGFAILLMVAGLMSAIVFVGVLFGGGLMFPAIAYENSDNYEAISRSSSYICTRPWRMGGYAVVAAIYGAICYLFMRFLVFLSMSITHGIVAMGVWTDSSKVEGVSKMAVIWPRPEFFNLFGNAAGLSRNFTESIAAFGVYLAMVIAGGILVSFVISFYLSANTVIYALMRQTIDNTSLDSVYVQIEEIQQEPSE